VRQFRWNARIDRDKWQAPVYRGHFEENNTSITTGLAGMPFAMPFSLSLSPDEASRWFHDLGHPLAAT
jgi:hypothetical protein